MTGKDYYYIWQEGNYVVYTGMEGKNRDGYMLHKGDIFKVEFLSEDKTCFYARNKEGKVMSFSTKAALQSFEMYDVEKLGLPDNWRAEKPKAQLKEGEHIVDDWYLTCLQEITAQALSELHNMDELIDGVSRDEQLEWCRDWAQEFSQKYGYDYDFGGDFWGVIDSFVNEKIGAMAIKDFCWDEQAIVNLQYIQNANCCPEDEFIGNPQSDRNRLLAALFTTYERSNNINYDQPEQADYETTITKWLNDHK